MTILDEEISVYEAMRSELENKHMGEWVLIHDGALIDAFASFDDAATSAVTQFGRGPYLIRQVGATPVVLPASVVYNLQYAQR